MPRSTLCIMLAAAAITAVVRTGHAQLRRHPAPGGAASADPAAPRDARFPYAGLWRGMRTMPVGADEIRLRFTVADGKYAGVLIHPDGSAVTNNNLTMSAAGLTWEQPNSGGGTWVYRVRLAAADSMVGTLELRDAPANFNPPPKGTLVLTRQPATSPRSK